MGRQFMELITALMFGQRCLDVSRLSLDLGVGAHDLGAQPFEPLIDVLPGIVGLIVDLRVSVTRAPAALQVLLRRVEGAPHVLNLAERRGGERQHLLRVVRESLILAVTNPGGGRPVLRGRRSFGGLALAGVAPGQPLVHFVRPSRDPAGGRVKGSREAPVLHHSPEVDAGIGQAQRPEVLDGI